MTVLSPLGRTRVMGVLNVTPDSFSDGGSYLNADAAAARGRALVAAGADLVDVGGESTRPGAGRVPVAEELRRVLPVVRALAADGIAVSIDTMRAEVAVAAVEAGAVLVNDVSGGSADPGMAPTVAGLGCPFVVSHWRGASDVMNSLARYDDVVTDVVDELRTRVDAVLAAGVAEQHVVLDPGLGFAKDAQHNWQLLSGLDRLQELGFPVLIGASRKRFLASVATGPEASDRDDATAAVTALVAAQRVWGVRVHEVAASAAAVQVAAAVHDAAIPAQDDLAGVRRG